LNPDQLADFLASIEKEDWGQFLKHLETITIDACSQGGAHDSQAYENKVALKSKLITALRTMERPLKDAMIYRKIPEELRTLFESDSYTLLKTGIRLKESANARLQMHYVREYLDMVRLNHGSKCDECEITEILKAIDKVSHTSYLEP
jgi:hypothetical protein